MKYFGNVKLSTESRSNLYRRNGEDAKEFWIIECEPHISLRLKRVFGKLGNWSFGRHEISANEDNSRDLQWFLIRYPMEISQADKNRLRVLSDKHRATEQFISEFYKGKHTKRRFQLAEPAREYQKEAAEMNLRMKGLLNADELGTGKTVSFITMLTEPITLPAVVVTLAHLTGQWQEFLKRFSPNLRTHIVKAGTPYEIKVPIDVFILNYHKLAGWSETFAKFARTICFDEAQELRRDVSQKYVAAKYLAAACQYRSGLSATPIYNYGGEFFNVVDVLRPGALGTRDEFVREWCVAEGGNHLLIKDPKAFGSYLRDAGIMIRRTRKELGREIPSLQKIYQTVEADTDALNKVSKSCAELARLILREDKGERGEQMQISEQFDNMLRQATGIAKAPYVASFVRLLVESGEKVILYGWHRAVYEIWNDMLHDLMPAMYTGSESSAQKEDEKQRFIKGNTDLMIISLRAGQGLDGLQHVCRTGVVGELDWSPGVYDQCIGRYWRDGQADPCLMYFMVSEYGSDPTVAEVAGIKREQIIGVIDPNAPLVEKLQVDPDHIKKLARRYLEQRA